MMKLVSWATLSSAEKMQTLARPAVLIREKQTAQVQVIIDTVKKEGDSALLRYAKTFDHVELTHLKLKLAECVDPRTQLTEAQYQALKHAKNNIVAFHEAQMPQHIRVETQAGVVCQKQYRPLSRVGLYIPGGSAPLPSTVLMTALPAALAGCPIKVLCTPPQSNGLCHPTIMAAAQLAGIESIYLVGGAQAIAAMAYGTQTIPKVDKIFGPGNSWVTLAKTLVSQDPAGAAIDMPAGPSEVMVIADLNADPHFVAADLLSQAEHGPDSQVILVSDSLELIKTSQREIQRQCAQLTRADTAKQALTHSVAICVNDMDTAIHVANEYAPEHLILLIDDASKYTAKITHAGSVFLGHWAPESMGDYASGTNHVLPTYGYARAYSGLSVIDYMHAITFQELTRTGFTNLAKTVVTLAEMEGLDAHANAVKVRLDALNKE